MHARHHYQRQPIDRKPATSGITLPAPEPITLAADNTTIAQAGGDQNAELRVHKPQAKATESVSWPDLISALRKDVPSLATYDRAALTQMINGLDEAGPSGPEPSRATEILGWLRDKGGTRLAAQVADGMWSAKKEYLETYVGG